MSGFFCWFRFTFGNWRGSLETSGQFNLTDKWTWGWDGTLVSDKTYMQDYGLYKVRQSADLLCVRSRARSGRSAAPIRPHR